MKNSYDNRIVNYITSVTFFSAMLNNNTITKPELLQLEKKLLAKYGLPEKSIYRDHKIIPSLRGNHRQR